MSTLDSPLNLTTAIPEFMKINLYLLFLSIFLIAYPALAQQPATSLDPWKYLIGNWTGEGNGTPGEGKGTFTFTEELRGNIITRNGRTEFPAKGETPPVAHEDRMVIFADFKGAPVQAIYFDNEGHTIHYTVDYQGDMIILTSSVIPGVPRFRLTYQKLSEQRVNILFAIASPDKPDDFQTYIEGISLKTK